MRQLGRLIIGGIENKIFNLVLINSTEQTLKEAV